jgi:hypothetical protein
VLNQPLSYKLLNKFWKGLLGSRVIGQNVISY